MRDSSLNDPDRLIDEHGVEAVQYLLSRITAAVRDDDDDAAARWDKRLQQLERKLGLA